MAPPSGETTCIFQQCFCRWRRFCSPRIPSVAPGRDYENMPAGADDRASWSLLVGYFSSISAGECLLRLHRFRVARSGRVLGRSGDPLEIWDDVDYEAKDASSHISDVTATPSPDGCSLCLFRREIRHDNLDPIVSPRPLQLNLNLGADDRGRGITVSPLPCLPQELKPGMPTRPISAAGHLWAPYLTKNYGPSRLAMLRLDKDDDLWVEVASIDLPQKGRRPVGGRALQGYAVVGSTILLSLLPSMQPFPLFFTFNCSTKTLAAVTTTEGRNSHYTPIHERGVYVEEDDTIYFLSGSAVCAYKLCKDQDQYWMAPPTTVDCLLPFEEGYGFLTHLGGRIMCAVWIGVSFLCSCNTLHVVITTFLVEGNDGSNCENFVPEHVNILHSTCRQLDMSPSKPSDSSEFRFLQEYEESDYASATASQKMLTHHQIVPSMLTDTCCRRILNGIAYSPSVVLDDSAIQINKALYIICQVASCSTVYQITISDGRLDCQGKTLTPHCIMDRVRISNDDLRKHPLSSVKKKHPLSWHFVCGSTSIYAIPSEQREIYTCSVDSGSLFHFHTQRPTHFYSTAHVLYVGSRIVAISDSFEGIYIFYKPYHNTWRYQKTYGSFNLRRRIILSGYVVLSKDSFMVSEADTSNCYLLDLSTYRWTAVSTSYYSPIGLLSGRSLYVEGFIYTCRNGGFAAYEFTEEYGFYYLGDEINLPFSWLLFWESDRMCFEYVGKGTRSDAIMFCVVQGGDYNRHDGSPDKHPISITTVQIKTERTYNNTLKPLAVGHVDIGTSFVVHSSETIWTSFCFIPLEKNDIPEKGKSPKNPTTFHREGLGPPLKKNPTTFHWGEGSDRHERYHGRYMQTHPPARDSVSSVHQPTFKIFCKADMGCCLAVYDGTLVLAPTDSNDRRQHWFRDTRLSTAVKDEEGNPVMSLVNMANGLAIKHSLGPYHPVRLVEFNPDDYDESLLWTESCDLGKDFGCIRMLHDISQVLDAFRGDGMQMPDRTTIVLSKWAKSDTQSWKIVYWNDEANATCGGLYAQRTYRIYSKADVGFSVTVRDGAVCLMPSNRADKYQHWIKDMRYENRIKDEEGYPAFALVNRFIGEAMKCLDKDHPVKLVPYNPNYVNKLVLWTESCDMGHGFRCIRPLDSINLNFHAFLDDKDHGTNVVLRDWSNWPSDNQCWKIDCWCKSHNCSTLN